MSGASPAAPHHFASLALLPEPSPPPCPCENRKNCLPWNRSLVPKRLGSAAVNDSNICLHNPEVYMRNTPWRTRSNTIPHHIAIPTQRLLVPPNSFALWAVNYSCHSYLLSLTARDHVSVSCICHLGFNGRGKQVGIRESRRSLLHPCGPAFCPDFLLLPDLRWATETLFAS